ncbi:hypothetical protein GGS20DRAFT_354706 [Poronia punctata]|nr:hypothetical protein GGS20DRAFT_354706 [Poronia punctata]
MASIGPTLPPHLAKRKRTPDDEASEDDTPPTKMHAPESAHNSNDKHNTEEIDLESSDSDDGYGPPAPKQIVGPAPPPIGPSLPPQNTSTRTPTTRPEPTKKTGERRSSNIGPTLPPTVASANTDEIPIDDDDNHGPAPPEPKPAPAPAPAPKRVHGPAPPSAALSERPTSSPNPHSDSDSDSDSEDDDDDDYGPALPTATSHLTRQARALEAAAAAEAAALAAGPKRDDWMLLPPTSNSGPDPTKLKARKFNSGPRHNPNDNGGGEISSIWTETPEQKRKRLENAVLGRDDSSTTATATVTASGGKKQQSKKPKTREDIEQEERIRQFTEATRGRSLYEEHQEAKAAKGSGGSGSSSSISKAGGAKKGWIDEEEDDPSKRAFDKEKDMKLGGRIGASQRKELLNKAADFGGRFAKGKYL